MTGDIFRFKNFDIHQGKCTMRVNTDGVLLGAWSDTVNKSKVLDIGTGTGVIALMIGFKNPNASVTAIDIDENAVEAATFNAANINTGSRINILHISIQEFCINNNEKFDLIVSNPPYFHTGTKPENRMKMAARHTTDLPHEVLVQCVCELLNEDGCFDLILPFVESVHFRKLALEAGLKLQKLTYVHSKKDRPIERVLMRFGHKGDVIVQDSIVIHDIENPSLYSQEYINLTKDYYLFM